MAWAAQSVLVSRAKASSEADAKRIARQVVGPTFRLHKVDTTERYYRVRVRNPDRFLRGTLRTMSVSGRPGVRIIRGELKGRASKHAPGHVRRSRGGSYTWQP